CPELKLPSDIFAARAGAGGRWPTPEVFPEWWPRPTRRLWSAGRNKPLPHPRFRAAAEYRRRTPECPLNRLPAPGYRTPPANWEITARRRGGKNRPACHRPG